MNAAFAIAARELRDKSRLFLTAAALATIPFLATLLPGSRPFGQESVVAMVAGFLSIALGWGVALTLGASTIGRELSDGRLSFYFSKPIPPWAIWAGKAAAALIAALGCFAIVAVPAFLYSGETWTSTWTLPPPLLLAVTVLGAIVLFFVTHAAASMIRSRSALIAVDFVLLVIAVAAVALLLRPLLLGMAVLLTRGVAVAVGAAVLLAMMLAPVGQLAVGRTDKKRSHAALSKFLWPAIAVILLVAALYVAWVVSVGPDELVKKEDHLAQSPQNGWLWITGQARNRGDYHASFLVAPDGKWQRVPPIWWGAMFSRDGSRVAWLEPQGWRPPGDLELIVRDLSTSDARPLATGLTGYNDFVMSDDGRRVAIVDGDTVSVHDLDANRLLVSARGLPASSWGLWFYFVGPDIVRIITLPGNRDARRSPTLWELNVAQRKLTKTGTVEPIATSYPVATPDGSRLLFRREGLVVDGRTGATLVRLPAGRWGSSMLSDGTLLTLGEAGALVRMTIYAPDGTRRGEVSLPGMRTVVVRGEIAPGKIMVNGTRRVLGGREDDNWRAFIIDTATAKVERVDENFYGPFVAWRHTDPRPLPLDTGRALAGYGKDGKLVLWDPRTGGRKALEFR